MVKYKAIRRDHRSTVTRLINKIEELSAREIRTAIASLKTKREVLKTPDNQILDVTEVENMKQEILDTKDFKYNTT